MKDLGSNPSVELSDRTRVMITPYRDRNACKASVYIKLVFEADGEVYTKRTAMTVDSPDSDVLQPSSLSTRRLTISMSPVPCEQEEIPEFPTVALPIASILGLAFFFQRRKE